MARHVKRHPKSQKHVFHIKWCLSCSNSVHREALDCVQCLVADSLKERVFDKVDVIRREFSVTVQQIDEKINNQNQSHGSHETQMKKRLRGLETDLPEAFQGLVGRLSQAIGSTTESHCPERIRTAYVQCKLVIALLNTDVKMETKVSKFFASNRVKVLSVWSTSAKFLRHMFSSFTDLINKMEEPSIIPRWSDFTADESCQSQYVSLVNRLMNVVVAEMQKSTPVPALPPQLAIPQEVITVTKHREIIQRWENENRILQNLFTQATSQIQRTNDLLSLLPKTRIPPPRSPALPGFGSRQPAPLHPTSFSGFHPLPGQLAPEIQPDVDMYEAYQPQAPAFPNPPTSSQPTPFSMFQPGPQYHQDPSFGQDAYGTVDMSLGPPPPLVQESDNFQLSIHVPKHSEESWDSSTNPSIWNNVSNTIGDTSQCASPSGFGSDYFSFRK